MTRDRIIEAARRLIAMRDSCQPCERLPDDLRPRDEDDGYAIQAEVARQRAAAGKAHGGWKIGCTTVAMQQAMGVPGPCGGAVMAGQILANPATYPRSGLVRPLAECEVAVRLGSDIPPHAGGHTVASVTPHVAACMTAIELADSRYPDSDGMGAPDYIADDFFQRAIVLGNERTDWSGLDLTAARGTTTINGNAVGEGISGEVMGHPFAALAWFADRLAGLGLSLRAGEVVLTGAVVPAKPLEQGETAVCAIEGLGEVRLSLT